MDKGIYHIYATTLITMSNMKELNKLNAKMVIEGL